jgi:hypothetical protein
MAIQVPMDMPFGVHIVYSEPPDPVRDIDVSCSNPDIALAEGNPAYPGDPYWWQVTATGPGPFVVGCYDGVVRGWLPEMTSVPPGAAPALPDQEIVLG